MVIPYECTVQFDLSKILLENTTCQKMTKNSLLKLYPDSGYYGASQTLIFQLAPPAIGDITIPSLSDQAFQAPGGTYENETKFIANYRATYDTPDTVLAAWQSAPISLDVNVFRIIPKTTAVPDLVILNASPNVPYSINALDLFTTNMDGNTDFPGYSKNDLTVTMTCVNPTIGTDPTRAASNNCCAQVFLFTGNILTKQNVLYDQYCDGLYAITFEASNPNWTLYKVSKTVNIKVKYDCLYLKGLGIYMVPLTTMLNHWPDGTQSSSVRLAALTFKIGDPTLDVYHGAAATVPNLYSCLVQYDFVCPAGQSNCQYFNQVFQSGINNAAMRSLLPRRTQLRVNQTTNHLAMEFDGTNIQVNAYLFSTEVIPDVTLSSTTGDTPQYAGNPNYVDTCSWTVPISVTKNCAPTIIHVTETFTDTSAELSSTQSVTIIVNQEPATTRTKRIIMMDLSDPWDSKYCRADFNKFTLRSTQLSDNYSTMFSYTNPTTASINPQIQLIADANVAVKSPTCTLSTRDQINQVPAPASITYTKSCEFSFQVEAFIGSVSFGFYTQFKVNVQNECYSFDTTKAPVSYNHWDYIGSSLPFTYEIWWGATSSIIQLPKLSPKLTSEISDPDLPTAAEECGAVFYTFEGLTPTFASIQNPAVAQYPQLQIFTINPSNSGQTASTDYKKLYSFNLNAVFANFADGPKFSYNGDKLPAQPAIEFYLQDRCLGMYFDNPRIQISTTDIEGNKQTIQAQLSSSTRVDYGIGSASSFFELERVTPYLYTIQGETPTKADGRCGQLNYNFKSNERFPDLVQLTNPSDGQTPSLSIEPLKFSVYSAQRIDQGDYPIEVEVSSVNSLYPTVNFTIVIRVSCVVANVENPNKKHPNFYIKADGAQSVINFENLRQLPDCGYDWIYLLTIIEIKDINLSIDFDSIRLSNPKIEGTQPTALAVLNKRQVSFKVVSPDFIGKSYASFITATLKATSEQPEFQARFELARFTVESPVVTTPSNSAPFIDNFVNQFSVAPGQKDTLNVGKLKDLESPQSMTLTNMTVRCKGLYDWLKLPILQEPISELWIGVDVPQGVANETCVITFTVSDNDPKFPKKFSEEVSIIVSEQQKEPESVIESPPLKNDEQIKVEQRIEDLLMRLNPPKKETKRDFDLPLILSAKQISSKGVLTMAFNRPVMLNLDYFTSHQKEERHLEQLTKEEMDYINQMMQNAFQIEYRPRSDELRPDLLQFTVLDFRKSQEIDIQLEFDEPLFVSFESEANNRLSMDQLLISLKDADIFIDPNKSAPLTPDLLQKEVVIVPKLEPIVHGTSITQLAQQTTDAIVKGLVPSTLLVNILLGVSLKKLWSAVNLLQFVTYVNLWRVSLPANLDTFFKKASFFARGDWIPKEWIIGKLHLKPKTPEDKQSLQIRFLICILVVMAIITLAVLGLICICKNHSARILRFCQNIKQKIFWNALIRYSLQSYLDFAVSTSLAVAISKGLSITKLGLNSTLFILIAISPAGYLILLHKKKQSLRSTEVKNQIGTLYQSMNVKSFAAVCYNVVFLWRRMIFAVITAFAGSYDGGLTVALVVAELIFFNIFLVTIKPQDTTTGNRIELASEILLTHCFFGMMACLSTKDPKQQYFVAWLSISAIATLVLVCVAYLASDSVGKLIQWVKKKLAVKKRLAEIERRNREMILAQQEINEVRVVQPSAANPVEPQDVEPRDQQQILPRRIKETGFIRTDRQRDPYLQRPLSVNAAQPKLIVSEEQKSSQESSVADSEIYIDEVESSSESEEQKESELSVIVEESIANEEEQSEKVKNDEESHSQGAVQPKNQVLLIRNISPTQPKLQPKSVTFHPPLAITLAQNPLNSNERIDRSEVMATNKIKVDNQQKDKIQPAKVQAQPQNETNFSIAELQIKDSTTDIIKQNYLEFAYDPKGLPMLYSRLKELEERDRFKKNDKRR